MSSKISPEGGGFQQFPITIQAECLTLSHLLSSQTRKPDTQEIRGVPHNYCWLQSGQFLEQEPITKLQVCGLATLGGVPVCVPRPNFCALKLLR